LAALAGAAGSLDEQPARIAVPTVVVTLGGRGCLARSGQRRLSPAAFAVTPVDTTGAGDTFRGALVAALSRGQVLAEALRQASAAAALACTEMGAQSAIPTVAEVADFPGPAQPQPDAIHMNAALRHGVDFDASIPAWTTRWRCTSPWPHPDIEVVGITTTFGNVTDAAGRRRRAVPARPGWSADSGHTRGGPALGRSWRGATCPYPRRRRPGQPARANGGHDTLDPRASAQFIVDTATHGQPGQITLVAVGPLGNLSLALRLRARAATPAQAGDSDGRYRAGAGQCVARGRSQHLERPARG